MNIENPEELAIVRDALDAYAQSHRPNAEETVVAKQLIEDCDAILHADDLAWVTGAPVC